MANINFVNNTLIAGTTSNPGLEDVLIATGPITTGPNLFAITNNSGGEFNGFRFELKGTGFTFNGGIPTAGTINAVSVVTFDGTPIIEVVAGTGGFGNTKLTDFFTFLKDANRGAGFALDSLLGSSNTVTGSAVADHATVFGDGSNVVFGGGGDDVLSAPVSATLVGGDGNDTFRLQGFDDYDLVAGANQDGTGGAGETNTLEIRGLSATNNRSDIAFDTITNINALHFVDAFPPVAPVVVNAAGLEVNFRTDQIGNGLVSLTLAVDGSTTASPLSFNQIEIFRDTDTTDTTPVNLDLSGWTFTNWDQVQNDVEIRTNSAVALDDSITGTAVSDSIGTFAGNDTLRGGGGADFLRGDDGSDTYVYGANEAVSGEEINDFSEGGGTDKVLVLGNNDFTGVEFIGVEQLAFGGAATATFDQSFINNRPGGGAENLAALGPKSATVIGDGNANTLAFQVQNPGGGTSGIDLSDLIFQSWTARSDVVTIAGTKAHDEISGSTQGDVINGGRGSDDLQGNEGRDAFLFDSGFGKGVDHVVDFSRKEHDLIQLEKDIFTKLKLGAVAKSAFTTGTEAHDQNDRIIFDKATGVVRYDDDGIGKHLAHIVTVLDDVSSLKHGDILVI